MVSWVLLILRPDLREILNFAPEVFFAARTKRVTIYLTGASVSARALIAAERLLIARLSGLLGIYTLVEGYFCEIGRVALVLLLLGIQRWLKDI